MADKDRSGAGESLAGASALYLLKPYWCRDSTSAFHLGRVIRGFKSYTRYRGEADCDRRCVSCKSPNWVSSQNVSFRCSPDLRFAPLLTLNCTTGQLKTALDRHFYALSDRRQHMELNLRAL